MRPGMGNWPPTKSLTLGVIETWDGLQRGELTLRWTLTLTAIAKFVKKHHPHFRWTTVIIDFGWQPPMHEIPTRDEYLVIALGQGGQNVEVFTPTDPGPDDPHLGVVNRALPQNFTLQRGGSILTMQAKPIFSRWAVMPAGHPTYFRMCSGNMLLGTTPHPTTLLTIYAHRQWGPRLVKHHTRDALENYGVLLPPLNRTWMAPPMPPPLVGEDWRNSLEPQDAALELIHR